MEGGLIGVFGSNAELKNRFLGSIAKRSETEGITVYSRVDAARRYSFIDDSSFPERIQGCARIASICDNAYYVFPSDGKLSPSDGELAVLIDSFRLSGSIEVIDAPQAVFSEIIKAAFKGLRLSSFPINERSSQSSIIQLSEIKTRADLPRDRTLIYIDRAFNVKGVGLVVLGFVLSGQVAVHDKLRLIPSDGGKLAEVKGIQISDEDFEKAERGIRVGLSLKGVDLKDLEKISWLDDGSFELTTSLEFEFSQSPYYKQQTIDRDLHVQINGEILVSKVIQGKGSSQRIAKLGSSVPKWPGMPVGVIDLNAKPLRVAGGGVVS